MSCSENLTLRKWLVYLGPYRPTRTNSHGNDIGSAPEGVKEQPDTLTYAVSIRQVTISNIQNTSYFRKSISPKAVGGHATPIYKQ